MDCTICVAKTKALISFAITAKLICVFVFAYAKSRFSHDAAQISKTGNLMRGFILKQLTNSLKGIVLFFLFTFSFVFDTDDVDKIIRVFFCNFIF